MIEYLAILKVKKALKKTIYDKNILDRITDLEIEILQKLKPHTRILTDPPLGKLKQIR